MNIHTPELKQCPFCGSAAKVNVDAKLIGKSEHAVYVACSNRDCIMMTDIGGWTPEQWNTRAANDAHREELRQITVALFSAIPDGMTYVDNVQAVQLIKADIEQLRKDRATLRSLIRAMWPICASALAYTEHRRTSEFRAMVESREEITPYIDAIVEVVKGERK